MVYGTGILDDYAGTVGDTKLIKYNPKTEYIEFFIKGVSKLKLFGQVRQVFTEGLHEWNCEGCSDVLQESKPTKSHLTMNFNCYSSYDIESSSSTVEVFQSDITMYVAQLMQVVQGLSHISEVALDLNGVSDRVRELQNTITKVLCFVLKLSDKYQFLFIIDRVQNLNSKKKLYTSTILGCFNLEWICISVCAWLREN